MGQTIAEKIISAHAGAPVRSGDLAVCNIDFLMMHDVFAHIAIDGFRKMNGKKVFDPRKVAIIFDHSSPAPNSKTANIHALTRNFAKEQGTIFYEAGEGVCHQLMVEKGYAQSGMLILGTDSHTVTYGAVGALSTGVGATDAAVTLLTGQQWLRVPPTVKINYTGKPHPVCSAKDIILYTIGKMTVGGCGYKSVEFTGPWFENASLADRMTISNMVVEMGAKCGFPCGSKLGITPDADAVYESSIDIDLARVEPCVAYPHMVDLVHPVPDAAEIPVAQGVIGSCTNGRIEDLRIAARILKGRKVKDGCRLLVMPASNFILQQAASEGVLNTLIDAGAVLCTPGCGICCGTLGGVPADGENVISTTNRNFRGRMGNNQANVYLASPATVAVSMLSGYISDPRNIL
jgi:3-isopropylmalate/(R)-2-methylmalate dehydratase large subunit